MTAHETTRVVFDCPVFAQALINPRGPAAECLALAQVGRIVLFVSEYVIQEVRELPLKLNARLGITADRVDALLRDVATFAVPVANVPSVYAHPIDPDDSPYINLAIAADAKLIVTRDKHLLNLMDASRSEAIAFRNQFPAIEIITPVALLENTRRSNKG
jgi:putative PIN family toxin of toxin-antitoxin system